MLNTTSSKSSRKERQRCRVRTSAVLAFFSRLVLAVAISIGRQSSIADVSPLPVTLQSTLLLFYSNVLDNWTNITTFPLNSFFGCKICSLFYSIMWEQRYQAPFQTKEVFLEVFPAFFRRNEKWLRWSVSITCKLEGWLLWVIDVQGGK